MEKKVLSRKVLQSIVALVCVGIVQYYSFMYADFEKYSSRVPDILGDYRRISFVRLFD